MTRLWRAIKNLWITKWLFETTQKPIVDDRTINIIVGVIALVFASVEGYLTKNPIDHIDSISAAFHYDGLPKTLFIGFLFAIAAVLLAYNGKSRFELWFTKVAAIAAVGIVLAPCSCGDQQQKYGEWHAAFAATMFSVLAAFCCLYCYRAFLKYKERKKHPTLKNPPGPAFTRFLFYIACAVAIILAIVLVTIDLQFGHELTKRWPDFLFWAEFAGLVGFGWSWLVASRVFFATKDEKYKPFSKNNPPNT